MSTQVGVARGLLVHAAADLATDALARCPIDDLRPRQGLATALRWVAGRAPSSEAWALGFALSALAERHEGVAAETLRATACLSFACDDRADVVFYAHRADAARSVAHAVRALGDPSVASDVVRRRIPLSTFLEAFDLASRPPPRPATPSGPHAPTTDSFYC
ncbi:MAG TPA: hypothetical protein RMH99_03265 [Sandaracinaceae bacterium LLY-WYZ-13_1]|nr:hypothetical protein [Sandaracinaceae bacterium LLY-WYZ-13_1]